MPLPPGLAHALIGLLIGALVGGAAVLAGWPFGVGVVAATAFYVGRERRQSEEWAGSNRIPPWTWKPRAARDIAWPALATTALALAVWALRAA